MSEARDYFEDVRQAAKRCERTRRMLQAMEVHEQSSGAGLGGRVSGGGNNDPMCRVDSRIDKEALWHRRIADDEKLLDEATSVLYGEHYDGSGGVDAALGSEYADVLWWRYLAAESWGVVAKAVGTSRTKATELANVALEYVDSVGLYAARQGAEA